MAHTGTPDFQSAVRTAALVVMALAGAACAAPTGPPPALLPTAAPIATPTANASPTVTATATAVPPTATPPPPPRPVAAAVAVRSAGFQTAYGGREIIRGNPDDPRVALTFDCGSVAGASARILDTLKEHGLRATFFMTGQYTERYPGLVGRMVADGHEFANHSYGHPDFTKLSDEAILAELGRTDDLVRAFSGSSTKPWMRMPFGARNGRVMDVVSGAGYASVFWTLDSGDWLAEATVASVGSRVLGGIKNGAIVVHHCAAEQTAGALPAILAGFTERGLEPVTLRELLR